MSAAEPQRGGRVVLRYVDDWDELRAQLRADRAVGLAPSAVRDAVVTWLDPDAWVEIGTLVRRTSSSYRGGDEEPVEAATTVPADGLIAGWGRRRGQLVFVVADDPALGGGARGAAAADKATRIRGHALEQGAVLVQVLGAPRAGAPGAAVDEVAAGVRFVRHGWGLDIDVEAASADRILKVAIVTEALTEQAAVEASWCHLVVLVGPTAGLHGFVGAEALALGHADAWVPTLAEALEVVGAAVDRLPPNPWDGPVSTGAAGAWSFELAPRWAEGVRTRLEVLGGRCAGVIRCGDHVEPGSGAGEDQTEVDGAGARQRPGDEAGLLLDAAAASKALRLARFCAAFRLPLVVEHRGIELPAAPTRADVDAVDRLRSVLHDHEVFELALGDRRLADDLAVPPLWSSHDHPGGREALLAALASLPPARLRPDQDERARRWAPRTLWSD